MHELLMVRHCSPTLAGIKTANLFSHSFECIKKLEKQIKDLNFTLNPKGVYLRILRHRSKKALIYVYRPNKLVNDFLNKDIKKFLSAYGYTNFHVEDCIDKLSNKLYKDKSFPHEIGLFLEYPLADVKGFIENKGKNYKHAGAWKVYSNESKAKEIFQRYKRCTNICFTQLSEGLSIYELTAPESIEVNIKNSLFDSVKKI